MLLIRRFEERCAELYSATKIRGFLHLYVGEEAVATGVMAALGPEDAVVSTYREHGHALARGVPVDSIMAEMFGRQTGCSRGRGGSMHLFHAPTRFLGGNAIVAGGIPLAVGLALADRYSGRDRVTVCFFGEGAAAEGEFHESLNLAALWKLPVLFCCENNRYAMGTSLAHEHARTDLALRASTYGLAAWPVDGMDVLGRRVLGPAGGGGDPPRRRPALPGAADLPVPGTLDVRPGPLPREGRGRDGEGPRPDHRARPSRMRADGELTDDLLADDGAGDRRHDRRRGGQRRRGATGTGRGADPLRDDRSEGAVMGATTVETTYREALREAIREALARDDRVFLMGEDVGAYGGCFAVSLGLLEEFGPDRIRDTPLSESAFVGAGIGAALGGLRPIVEIMTVNFSLLALDQILNNAASLQHMSGGQFQVPLVIRMTTGAGRQLAAQHSHSLEGWYAHIPGIRVAGPRDGRGRPRDALDRPAGPRPGADVRERLALPGQGRRWPQDAGPVDLDSAAVRRPGDDVTLITYGGSLGKTLEAAEELAGGGVSAEVIDLRTLRPLDDACFVGSVRRTHRAVVIDEGWRSGSISAEISARITEQALYDLDAPVERVCSAEVPMPYAKHMEEAALPQVPDIVGAARRTLGES